MKEVGLIDKISFNLMVAEYKIKSIFSPPDEILKQTNIQPGDHVVDYGCGPGRFTIPLAQMVGNKGKVFAVDINPIAFEKVKNKAKTENLENVEYIDGHNIKMIEKESIDVVILYDTLHDLNDMRGTVKSISGMLKTGGYLSFKDHTLKKQCIKEMTANLPLNLERENEKTIEFKKV